MKQFFIVVVLLLCAMHAQSQATTLTLKSILLEQLRTTHNVKDWFVPADSAIWDLQPEQAMWKDGSTTIRLLS